MKKILLALLIVTTQSWAQEFEVENSDFKTLFNKHRMGQPAPTPWAGDFYSYRDHGTAVKVDASGKKCVGESCGVSPMETLGLLMGNKKAYEWEKKNHSCDSLEGEQKTSCEGWWGHCNGWAGAAIKDKEPRKPITIRGRTLSIADQKGILSEFWLTCNSLFSGNTDKSLKTGGWVFNSAHSSFKSFWDVSPRTFFLLFTNYIGIQKTGLVIDRFTGEEVWNQPVVGYRHLSLSKDDIWEQNGKYYARITTKIFWANDLGTQPGHISSVFDITKTTDDIDANFFSRDYEQRNLSYVLQFNAPVEIDASGNVITAGKIIGDGMWQHFQEFDNMGIEEKEARATSLNQTHPDFIWLPTNAFVDNSGYGNPMLDAKVIAEISKVVNKGEDSTPNPTPEPEPTPAPAPTPETVYQTKGKVPFSAFSKLEGAFNAANANTPEKKKAIITKFLGQYLVREGIYNAVEFEVNDVDGSNFYLTIKSTQSAIIAQAKKLIQKFGGSVI